MDIDKIKSLIKDIECLLNDNDNDIVEFYKIVRISEEDYQNVDEFKTNEKEFGVIDEEWKIDEKNNDIYLCVNRINSNKIEIDLDAYDKKKRCKLWKN